MRFAIVILALIPGLTACCCFGVGQQNQGAEPNAKGDGKVENHEQSIRVTCDDLFLAYRRNEADADLRFTGKILEVTSNGQFAERQRLYKDNAGQYAYDFRSNVLEDWTLESPRPVVHFVFRKSETDTLAKGVGTTIRGKCIGNQCRDPSYGGMYPSLVDCVVVR